tara:strand:- start:1358 stop:2998 length:1641 start_codon:yes stop_codon:yes gene_type:complete
MQLGATPAEQRRMTLAKCTTSVLAGLAGLLTTVLIPACGDSTGGPSEVPDGGEPGTLDAGSIDSGPDVGDLDPPAPTLEASVADAPVRVVRGGTSAVTVSVLAERLSGDLSIWVDGLPPGVVSTPRSFPSTRDSVDVVVEATSEAAYGGPWPAEIHVASDGSPSLEVVLSVEVVVAGLPGSVDSTFGSAGEVLLPRPLGYMKLTVDSRGFTIVAGTGWDDPDTPEIDERPVVFRLQPNGLPDSGFGMGGLALGPSSYQVMVNDVVEHGDVVYVAMTERTSSYDGQSMVRRFQGDGTLDESFGSSGLLATEGGDLVVTPRGLVVAGRSGVQAVEPTGPTVAVFAPDPLTRSGRAVALGHALLLGTTGDTTRSSVEIAGLFDESGGAVAAWGTNGEAAVSFIPVGSLVWTRPVAALEDGSTYVVVRYVAGAADVHDGVVRLGPGGALDPTFGSAGYVTFGSEGWKIRDAVVDRMGRLVVLVEQPDSSWPKRHLVRFTDDGRVDGAFGDGGSLALEITADAIARDPVSDRVVSCGSASGVTTQCSRVWL